MFSVGAEVIYVNAPNGLNIRQKPTENSTSTQVLAFGQRVVVIDDDPDLNGWYRVEGGDNDYFGGVQMKRQDLQRKRMEGWLRRTSHMPAIKPVSKFARLDPQAVKQYMHRPYENALEGK